MLWKVSTGKEEGLNEGVVVSMGLRYLGRGIAGEEGTFSPKADHMWSKILVFSSSCTPGHGKGISLPCFRCVRGCSGCLASQP